MNEVDEDLKPRPCADCQYAQCDEQCYAWKHADCQEREAKLLAEIERLKSVTLEMAKQIGQKVLIGAENAKLQAEIESLKKKYQLTHVDWLSTQMDLDETKADNAKLQAEIAEITDQANKNVHARNELRFRVTDLEADNAKLRGVVERLVRYVEFTKCECVAHEGVICGRCIALAESADVLNISTDKLINKSDGLGGK